MAKAAGWVVLFTVVYVAGLGGVMYTSLWLSANGPSYGITVIAPFTFLIVASLLLAVVLGHAAAHASGRGPAVSLVVGVVVALWESASHFGLHGPHGGREFLNALATAAPTVSLFGLGGWIHRWRHRGKTPGPNADAPASGLEETGRPC
jgi:hypothetical protein